MYLSSLVSSILLSCAISTAGAPNNDLPEEVTFSLSSRIKSYDNETGFIHPSPRGCHNGQGCKSPEQEIEALIPHNDTPRTESQHLEGAQSDFLPRNLPLEQIEEAEVHTLRQVSFIHRHGDRTPIDFAPRDPLLHEPFWMLHGIGQLTNRGKARVHLLGKMLRHRYHKFLGQSLRNDQLLSRSSPKPRCLKSAQMFLAGFLALDTPNSVDSHDFMWDRVDTTPLAKLWQPAAIFSVPATVDGMLGGLKCQVLDRESIDVYKMKEVQEINEEFKEESKLLNETYGLSPETYHGWTRYSSTLEVERAYFEDRLSPQVKAAFDRIQEASNRMLGLHFAPTRFKRLFCGLLANDIVLNMRQMKPQATQAKATELPNHKRVVHYSAHDSTLQALLGVFEQWPSFPHRADYASSLIWELHEQDDEWYVRMFYLEHVPGQLHELKLAACQEGHPKGRCTLDRFEKFLEPYRIRSWQQWMEECGNDYASVDPYSIVPSA